MNHSLPETCLVVLMGASGAGKSTFASRHFAPTEVVSSDVCRALVADDPNDQSATKDAFDLVHSIVSKRLARGRLTVVDATNVHKRAREPLVALAREHHVLPVAVVLNVPAKVCHARNSERPDRSFGPHVVRGHVTELRRSLRRLKREGFRRVIVLDGVDEVDGATFTRTKLYNDLRDQHGPFDLIGDVHGCIDELRTLLKTLDYADVDGVWTHPDGRTAVFVGDLVDRGPDSPAVLELVMDMVDAGTALCVPGNHEAKLGRWLDGRNVKLTHGLDATVEQLGARDEAFLERVRTFIRTRISHHVLDEGRLVVAHAGLPEHMHGRASGHVRQFCLYGETTGETDEFGLPVRGDWAAKYRGRATVVYGHTPRRTAEWVNETLCIDTGCVFGGALTALRYPEREIVSVPAVQTWVEPARPLEAVEAAAEPDRPDGALSLDDVTGRRVIHADGDRAVTIHADHAAAALEVMSRFAVDPRWLIYLPPTMSPARASDREGVLEHPEDAFAYFRDRGVHEVICEQKHMGSRAVLVVCRDDAAAVEAFGERTGRRGVVYTRTGRPFFRDAATEGAIVDRVAAAAEAAGLWDELGATWLCLDAELMPWSAKAQELLQRQYAPVAAAARAGLSATVRVFEDAARRQPEAAAIRDHFAARLQHAEAYAASYRPYCWPVGSMDDLRIAPFHLMASDGVVHTSRDHGWHMRTLARLAEHDVVLMATDHRVVALDDGVAESEATAWWDALVAGGGEGMVVKPLRWERDGRGGRIQPAIKCRGPEYLRLIYGPEYLEPSRLDVLRRRRVGGKRRLADMEYALGLEGLRRFVAGKPLHRVHECVFGVLALESEPVDPRL